MIHITMTEAELNTLIDARIKEALRQFQIDECARRLANFEQAIKQAFHRNPSLIGH